MAVLAIHRATLFQASVMYAGGVAPVYRQVIAVL